MTNGGFGMTMANRDGRPLRKQKAPDGEGDMMYTWKPENPCPAREGSNTL